VVAVESQPAEALFATTRRFRRKRTVAPQTAPLDLQTHSRLEREGARVIAFTTAVLKMAAAEKALLRDGALWHYFERRRRYPAQDLMVRASGRSHTSKASRFFRAN